MKKILIIKFINTYTPQADINSIQDSMTLLLKDTNYIPILFFTENKNDIEIYGLDTIDVEDIEAPFGTLTSIIKRSLREEKINQITTDDTL